MKWVNPPVAYMLHAGVPLLLDAGVHLPQLHAGDRQPRGARGLPGPARARADRPALVQERRPGQADGRAPIAPQGLVDALEAGPQPPGAAAASSTPAQRDDAGRRCSGDRLDAVLCLMQAGLGDRAADHGLPAGADPLEGWIVSA